MHIRHTTILYIFFLNNVMYQRLKHKLYLKKLQTNFETYALNNIYEDDRFLPAFLKSKTVCQTFQVYSKLRMSEA